MSTVYSSLHVHHIQVIIIHKLVNCACCAPPQKINGTPDCSGHDRAVSLSLDGVVSLDELFVACLVDLVFVGTVNV